MLYKVVRFYARNKPSRAVSGKTGLYLEEAQAHCNDPESSWQTCTTKTGKARTRKFGPWFDGWTQDTRRR